MEKQVETILEAMQKAIRISKQGHKRALAGNQTRSFIEVSEGTLDYLNGQIEEIKKLLQPKAE